MTLEERRAMEDFYIAKMRDQARLDGWEFPTADTRTKLCADVRQDERKE
jgi:hypothetical protein